MARLMLLSLVACSGCLGTAYATSRSSCATVPPYDTSSDLIDQAIHGTLTSLGEAPIESYAGRMSTVVRIGSVLGTAAEVARLVWSGQECSMDVASLDQEGAHCAVDHVHDRLPTWECNALIECMTRDKDWQVMETRQDALRGEGFSWVEATNGQQTRVTRLKYRSSDEPPTFMELCLGHWHGVAGALAKSARH